MDVKLLRIDSRLVHGQVANNWAGSLGAEAILAVSDGAANDELRKTLMLQTGGGKVKVHVLGVEKAARVYKNPKYETLKAVIVVETPADIVRLLDLGLGVGTGPIDLGGVVGSHLRLVVLGDPGGRRRIGQQPHAHHRHDGGDQGGDRQAPGPGTAVLLEARGACARSPGGTGVTCFAGDHGASCTSRVGCFGVGMVRVRT